MSENHSHSITALLQQLDAGNSRAAHELWERVRNHLIISARNMLKRQPRRIVDEEDVAIMAFDALLRGVEQNRFKKINDRDDLWQILAMLAGRRAITARRSELADKRGGGRNRGESAFEQITDNESAQAGIGGVEDPHPETAEQLSLVLREQIDNLNDDVLREIVMYRFEGFTDTEIAEKTSLSVRTIQRKLALIRRMWQSEQSR
jgi:RNA polymerase sigma factor (sigma-70 family)